MIEVVLASSIVTTFLVALGGWLSRTWIIERLKADIKLENDSNLEELKAELSKASRRLDEIASASSQAYSQNQAALLPQKIQAIQTAWSSTLEWNQMAAASMFVSILTIDWVKKYSSEPSTKQTFETLINAPSHNEFLKQRNQTELVRPFLSEEAWALYFAYHSFYLSRISKAALLTISSIDHAEIFERVNERSLIKKSAPQEILAKYDANVLEGTNEYLHYLKEAMLEEFRAELSGNRDSKRAATNAAEIVNAAEALIQSSKQEPETPTGKLTQNWS